MDRSPQGWSLTFERRTSIYGVRWRQDGKRRHVSTGERDRGKALEAAASIYHQAQREPAAPAKRPAIRTALSGAGSDWIASLEDSLDADTVRKYDQYVDEWCRHFRTVAHLTAPAIEDWWRARLGEVKRKTVIKQLYALNGFLSWLVSRGTLQEAPRFTMPPKSATGTLGRPEIETVPLSATEVARLLAAMPEWPERVRDDGTKWRVRDRFVVAWETALRPATIDAIEAPRDYQRGAATLKIRDRDDKARFGREVPLSDAARAALDRSAPDIGPIFGRVDSHTAARYLRAAAVAAKLPADKADRVKAYDLRHARLTLLAESGNLVGVAYLAGHKAITTTNRYVHAHQAAALEVLTGTKEAGRTGKGRGGAGKGRG
jgi:integrase